MISMIDQGRRGPIQRVTKRLLFSVCLRFLKLFPIVKPSSPKWNQNSVMYHEKKNDMLKFYVQSLVSRDASFLPNRIE